MHMPLFLNESLCFSAGLWERACGSGHVGAGLPAIELVYQ